MNALNAPRQLSRAVTLGLSACLLAACVSSPQMQPELVRLESELSRLQADPAVAANAPKALADARAAVDLLGEQGRRMDDDLFDHNVYLADRLLQIAEAEGLAKYARGRIDQLSGERERLVADARAAEARRARSAAEQARLQAELAQADANRERLQAEMARAEAMAAREELAAMQKMMTDLQAKQTERGLVVTLGDVLFEVDRAELKPGAARNLDKLVAALREHPDTTVAIEGHTDSTGAASYNEELSRRRAQAVQNYLSANGIDGSRLQVRGLGEVYPVASNDTSAGRQQNRRVEIVIQNGGDAVASSR
jgi:outer membrane protein OmpA-like peptidoglycan-associated protein